jgi:hypothetical protein
MLATISAKHDLALAALDVDSDISAVELHSGMEELKRRLEQLLGTRPAAPIDRSQQLAVESQTKEIAARRDKVAAAGGELLGAALKLVGELIDNGSSPDPRTVDQIRNGLADCVDRAPDGRPQVRFTLPNDAALGDLATTLAKLLISETA